MTHDPSLRSWVASANRAGQRLPHPEPALRRLPARRQQRELPLRRGDRRSVLDLGALDMLASVRRGSGAEALTACARAVTQPTDGARARRRGRRCAAALSRMLRAGSPRAARAATAPRSAQRGRITPARAGSAITPTSTPPFTTPPPSGACSGRTSRCCPTTSGCRSPTTAAPPRSASPARRFAAPRGQVHARAAPSGRSLRPARGSTTSSRSASSSAPATRLGHADPDRPRPKSTCSGCACSTTGRRATSRPGSISRSGHSSPRASRPRSRPGW